MAKDTTPVPPGANKNFADRPQLDPVKEAHPADAGEVVALAEAETAARLAEKAEREKQEAEAEARNAEAAAKRNANAANIKTRSEMAKLTPAEQQAFREANGTVVEDGVKK